MANPSRTPRRRTSLARFGQVATRAPKLAIEPLEHRSMLAAVSDASPVAFEPHPETYSLVVVDPDFSWKIAECWITPPEWVELPTGGIDPIPEWLLEEEPAGAGSTDVTDEVSDVTDEVSDVTDEVSDVVDDGTTDLDPGPPDEWETPDEWGWCGTDQVMFGLGDRLVEQYREFVKLNPSWPEEHGAGGIQLCVITPSKHFQWSLLSTPGEARSFDAWFEHTYPLGDNGDTPLTDGDTPVTDGDAPVTTDDENLGVLKESRAVVAPTVVGSAAEPAPAVTLPMSAADAAWATLYTPHTGADPQAATPFGGRRRSR